MVLGGVRKEINITVSPKQASDERFYRSLVAKKIGIKEGRIKGMNVKRRSVDARKRNIRVNLGIEVFVDEQLVKNHHPEFDYPNVASKDPVIIVGAGPAGLFAALRLIELGFKPVVVERGKDVSARKRDIAAIHTKQIVDPDSNYGFGEGGAGTFSDGKLFTRSKKRGNVKKILEVFFFHGASEDILIEAHPHIGTNLLPKIITNIREQIKVSGGEVHFHSRVADLIVENDRCKGVILNSGDKLEGKAVILATGHSARDIYRLLFEKGLMLEPKAFAMGVRVEHPQELIDRIQYHGSSRGEYLPAAAYSFIEQVAGRGVYSFCMCPGGYIVPAATAPGEMLVNGMSPSARNGHFANSGIVVEIRPEDLPGYKKFGQFAGLQFQSEIEKLCFFQSGHTQFAPAQRLDDFIHDRFSSSLPKTSYHPGTVASSMHEWLPQQIRFRLQQGFTQMGKKAYGFVTNEAVIMGVESRTSSPVRIPRNPETLEHVQLKGLFPCGEGAGYAGGIVSSAVDGERCAGMVAKIL